MLSLRNSLVGLAGGLLLATGCASIENQRATVDYEPMGPDASFATMEEAVVDALAYAHLEAKRTGTIGQLRGGVITRTERGFTYGQVVTARPDQPNDIEYTLGARDVARFHAYPRTGVFGQDLKNEKPSRGDRKSVDLVDPYRRPLFVLTPRLHVKVYWGDKRPVQTVTNLHSYAPQPLYAGPTN